MSEIGCCARSQLQPGGSGRRFLSMPKNRTHAVPHHHTTRFRGWFLTHPLLPSLKDTSFFAVALIIVALDQIIKAAISALPADFSRRLLGSFLALAHVRNPGASFGILQGRTMFLIIFSCAIVMLILLFYRHAPTHLHSALALVLGGTVGNLIDRIRLGYVVDYILVPYWPAFNLADIAIVIGALVLILHLCREDKAARSRKRK